MSTTAITSSTAATAFAASDRIPVQTLGQDDFIKILVTQLTTQDPLNPQKDTEFIAQMAQFSALENSKTMAAELETLRAKQQFLQANALIGQQVEIDGGAANIIGTVGAVEMVDGEPWLSVNGALHSMDDIVRVSKPDVFPVAVKNTAPHHVD